MDKKKKKVKKIKKKVKKVKKVKGSSIVVSDGVVKSDEGSIMEIEVTEEWVEVPS